jgi:malonyl-CoA/methylmalonyl-CoA synthetase
MTIELIERARDFGDRIALEEAGRIINYRQLLDASADLAAALLGDRGDLEGERIAFMAPASIPYVVMQWAIWRAGAVAVPLNIGASEPELEHVFEVAGIERLLVPATYRQKVESLCARRGVAMLDPDEINAGDSALPTIAEDRNAMMIFTSGTTSKPKGVITSHANIRAQVETLVTAWEWRADDSIPLFLPMHHVHGIVNILTCALWSGARVETFPAFDADAILPRVAEKHYSLFMAVPTIYVKLIQALENLGPAERRRCCEGFAAMRLMVSGSAALPVKIHNEWQELTGQVLLERYGMTEIGMALSNPLHGERRPGTVGQPLPGVQVKLVNEEGESVRGENEPGEIWVKGPGVFGEYWGRPEATAESFVDDWFRTGDMAVVEDGYYRIMGRLSVDIIKSGGYKLSALEIEDTLLKHPAIRECAVVGVEDETWGEVVAAAVVADGALSLDELKSWAREQMSGYKVPRVVRQVDSLPRNAMGKVTKPAVKRLFAGNAS